MPLASAASGVSHVGAATLSGVAHVLVVEDDPAIRTAVLRALDGPRPCRHVRPRRPDRPAGRPSRTAPDIIVLDLGLPDLDGAEVLRMLRAVSDVPVIVATARDDDPTAVRALNAGADDFLAKPFSAAQLDARIRAVLRRVARRSSPRPTSSSVASGSSPASVAPRSSTGSRWT